MASAKLQSFLTDFYKLSDSRCEPEEYRARFADEGSLEGFAIGPMKLTKQPKDIAAWRSKAWDLVTSRRHRVLDVYPKAGGKEEEQFVILGDLLSDKKDGGKAYSTFAAEMKLDNASGKIKYYKVWLVSPAVESWIFQA